VYFIWDSNKADANLHKHGVDFQEATSVIRSLGYVSINLDSDADEDRYVAVGFSDQGRCLVVIFCERTESAIRIVSARKANWREMKLWHERK